MRPAPSPLAPLIPAVVASAAAVLAAAILNACGVENGAATKPTETAAFVLTGTSTGFGTLTDTAAGTGTATSSATDSGTGSATATATAGLTQHVLPSGTLQGQVDAAAFTMQDALIVYTQASSTAVLEVYSQPMTSYDPIQCAAGGEGTAPSFSVTWDGPLGPFTNGNQAFVYRPGTSDLKQIVGLNFTVVSMSTISAQVSLSISDSGGDSFTSDIIVQVCAD